MFASPYFGKVLAHNLAFIILGDIIAHFIDEEITERLIKLLKCTFFKQKDRT